MATGQDRDKDVKKSGLVAIVGRPNVGKSTLLNRIVGEKVAIVSDVPQTTRNQVRGIYTDERGQIVFIDTPGIHTGRDRLGKFMNKSAVGTILDADCLVHLTDASEHTGPDEEEVVSQIRQARCPVVLGFNKMDLKHNHVPEYISLWERAAGQPVTAMTQFDMLPLSGKTGRNVEKLLEILFARLPEGPALYEPDTVADIPQKMAIADIVREKFLNLLREELPHALAVVVEQMEPRKNKTLYIQALVMVETDSQKSIVIGKKGQILKTVGMQARRELEALLECKVFLEIYVKGRKRWRDDEGLLQEMGYV